MKWKLLSKQPKQPTVPGRNHPSSPGNRSCFVTSTSSEATWYAESLTIKLSVLTIHALHALQKLLAANITEEQGKTLVDAEGDVLRGLRKTVHRP